MFKHRYLAFSAAAVFAVTPISTLGGSMPWGHDSAAVKSSHATGDDTRWGGITPVHVSGPGQHKGSPTPAPTPTPTPTTPPTSFSNNIVPKVGTLMGAYVHID